MNDLYIPTQITRHTSYGAYLGRVELVGEGIGARVQPGQFAMVRRPGELDDAKPKPFAYFAVHDAHTIALMVRERPDSAGSLLRSPVGTRVPVLGPLGTTFGAPPKRVWAVAGGVGAAAFGTLARNPDAHSSLRVLVGIRSQADAGIITALTDRLNHTHAELVMSCEDGTLGRHGGVVDGLRADLAAPDAVHPDVIYACGPEPMLRAVANLAQAYGIACKVSVGVAMDCGVGTCGSCRHIDARGDTLLACVAGPVYPAAQLYG